MNKALNFLENVVQILENRSVAKTQHFQTSSLEKISANRVIGSGISGIVDTAIEFNHQFGTGAIKIYDITLKSLLPQKTHPQTRATQRLPQHILRSSWILTHFTLQRQQIRFLRHKFSVQNTASLKPLSIRHFVTPFSRQREKGSWQSPPPSFAQRERVVKGEAFGGVRA